MKFLCLFFISFAAASTAIDLDHNSFAQDLNCNDLSDIRFHCESHEFCMIASPHYSDFICDWLCEEVQDRLIQKCSSSQYYTSLSHPDATDLYSAVSDYFYTGNLNYTGLTVDHSSDNPSIIESEFWSNNPDSHSNYKNGWGTLMNDTTGISTIAIHINHPLHDVNSTFITGYVDQELNPGYLIVSGAHRYSLVNSVDFPTCPATEASCDELNYGADVAKYVNECDSSSYTTPFQVYHEVISDLTENLFSLSVHGFNSEEYPGFPTFLLTNGNSSDGNDCIPPDPVTSTIYHYLNDFFYGQGDFNPINTNVLSLFQSECSSENIALIVQQEINCLNQPTTCASSNHSPFSQLAGIWNPQGRYTNGYYDSNVNVGDSLILNDDTWLQIEISNCIRDNIVLYEKTAEIIASAIQDCKVNGNCQSCNETTPCSDPPDEGGEGVEYGIFEFDCSSNYSIGDVNIDGLLNVTDIINIVNHILEFEIFDDIQFYFSDINVDGTINIVDVVYLVQIILQD